MKSLAIVSFLWERNFAVLDRYLLARPRVVITLGEHVNDRLKEIIEARNSILITIESLLEAGDIEKISHQFNNIVQQGRQIMQRPAWRDSMASLEFAADRLNPIIEQELSLRAKYGLELISALDKARDQYSIELIIFNEEWLMPSKYAIWWAKTRGIPSIHLTHATALAEYFMVHSLVLSDVIAIFGERDVENLYDIDIAPERIRITGNPAWDGYQRLLADPKTVRKGIYAQYRLNPKWPLVIFATTWDSHGKAKTTSQVDPYRQTLESFVAVCRILIQRKVLANFMIKDRPANKVYGQSVFDEVIAQSGLGRDTFFYAWEDMDRLVVSTDILISVASNLSIEAMIAGVPTINFSGYSPSFEASAGILNVEPHPPEKMAQCIQRLLEDHEWRDQIRANLRERRDYYCAHVGAASNRVADLMAEMALQYADQGYADWRARQEWTIERCQRLLASVAAPDTLPVIHVILAVERSAPERLTETFTDLAAQTCANWRLTVVSEVECVDPLFYALENLEWIQVPNADSITGAMTEAATRSPAEWFFCAPAGLHLSPAFTLLTGLTLRDPSETLLLYTDEDALDGGGQPTRPKFKPDCNVELLRSQPYIGASVLIRQTLMLDPRVAILPPGLPRNYNAALLALERGATTIQHLAEILAHVPDALSGGFEQTLLAPLLVQQHLTRLGIEARIEPGPSPEVLFINYALTRAPLVSILMLAQDRPESLQSSLESLLEGTDYPHFEVLAIDNRSHTSAKLDGLEALQKRDSRVQVLHDKLPHHCAAFNKAATIAQGEFLLLIDSDAQVVQPEWLMRLVALGLQENVGIVGGRLLGPDNTVRYAGTILGLKGVAGAIGVGLSMNHPGYLGRAQLTQDLSAVSSTCLLIRRALYQEVGGLDERALPSRYNDIDLCLKVRARGLRVVWTPFATLAQRSASSLEKPDPLPEDSVRRSQRVMLDRWSPWLANDPAYNRHLSLRQGQWMLDGDFDVPWHPDWEPLPRIVAQSPDEMGVGQYRLIGPLKELTKSDRICSFLLPPLNSEKRFMPFVSELIRAKPTVLFLQNAFTHFHFDDLQSYAESLPDVFRIFGQDDIVFSVPQKSSARKHFGKDTKARVRKAVSLCHRAIVTTEPIAEAMRGMTDDIRVVPNYLERSRWGDLQPPRNERRKLRVGWAGAQQHQGDLEFILPVVEATANEVDWIFMGMCPPKLRYHVAEVHNAVPFDQYPAALAALDLDLAIAPLELNRFNTAKSNLRLLEYGVVGAPVIATDILPYRNAPVTRVPNNPKAWIDAIRAHVHDPDATRVAGEQLREWVLSHWMLDQHLDEWMKALLPD